MQGTKIYKRKIVQWREKAKKRRKEKESLKKRIKELIDSRNKWKEKYTAKKIENKQLIKSNSSRKSKEIEGEKPKHHSFSVQTILLIIWLRQQGNMSLRSCIGILKVLNLVMNLELRVPSKSSVQNWEKKLGYHRLTKVGKSTDNWAIILDESISVGQHKLLLILGVNLETYSFGEALKFSDTTVLDICIGSSWTGSEISDRLSLLKANHFSINYGVSDGGTNLRKALKDSEIIGIGDCTHTFGNLLKNEYKDCSIFKAFSTACGQMRQHLSIGKYAVLIPPKQRVKGRFLNLQPLAKWANEKLTIVKDKDSLLPMEMKAKLAWLIDYENFIVELFEHCQIMDKLFKILKHQGLNEQSKIACEELLCKSRCKDFFQNGVKLYLRKNLELISTKMPIICTSDIIESYFGKYKSQLAKTGNAMITDACLAMGNFNQNFEKTEIKEAMEKVKIIDLILWKKENIPTTLNQERRKLFKNTG